MMSRVVVMLLVCCLIMCIWMIRCMFVLCWMCICVVRVLFIVCSFVFVIWMVIGVGCLIVVVWLVVWLMVSCCGWWVFILIFRFRSRWKFSCVNSRCICVKCSVLLVWVVGFGILRCVSFGGCWSFVCWWVRVMILCWLVVIGCVGLSYVCVVSCVVFGGVCGVMDVLLCWNWNCFGCGRVCCICGFGCSFWLGWMGVCSVCLVRFRILLSNIRLMC